MKNAAVSFLVGLLTRHLGTKALALILSILVFAFVQNTLTGTKEIGDLTLRLELSQDVRERWVLLKDTVTVPDVRIQGLRRIVDPLAKELKQGERRVVLTESFLNRYDRTNLVMKPNVLRDILGEEVDVSMGTVRDVIKVDDVEEKQNVLVQIVPGDLVPPEGYRGGLPNGNIYAQPIVKRVRLLGPKQEMPRDPVLWVDVNLKKWADESGFELSEERETVSAGYPYVTIDWARSGIRQDVLRHFRVHAPEPTNTPLAATTF